MHILSHKFNSCCIHSHPCVHVHPFMFCASVVPPENPCLIQFQINHNFSVFRGHVCPFAQVQFLLCPFTSLHPCTSFRMSSFLVVSICILVSMCALSCSACLWFGTVTCMSHVQLPWWCHHADMPSASAAAAAGQEGAQHVACLHVASSLSRLGCLVCSPPPSRRHPSGQWQR